MRMPFVAALLFVLGAGSATASDPVTIVTPNPVTVTTVRGVGETRVFYTVAAGTTVKTHLTTFPGTVEIKPADPVGPVQSLRIVAAIGKPLLPSEAFSGVLIFEYGNGQSQQVAVTVTEAPAATFTVDPTQLELCLACGNPLKFQFHVTNTGRTVIEDIDLGGLMLRDGTGGHQWLLPDKKDAKTGTELAPGGSTSGLHILPGATKTLTVDLAPGPPAAGTYSGVLKVIANKTSSQAIAITARTPGPKGNTPLPFVLFLVSVVVGAIIAFLLERFFGTGGLAERAAAMLALETLRDHFGEVRTWISAYEQAHAADVPPLILPNTRTLVDIDIDAIDDLLAGSDLTPQELTARVNELRTTLRKRELLRRYVEAVTSSQPSLVAALDGVGSAQALTAYDAVLQAIITPHPAIVAPAMAQTAAPAAPASKRRWWSIRLWLMKLVRQLALIIAVFLTAYIALYAVRGCTFGSPTDYATVMLWALGVTGAGRALLADVRRP